MAGLAGWVRVGVGGAAHSIALSALCVCLASAACTAPDPAKLDEPPPTGDGGNTPMRDAAITDGGGGTGGDSGGAGSGGDSGGADSGSAMPECEPNPGDEVCPQRCPELCNNQDDDCDRQIDEHVDDFCPAQNAVGACVRGECIIVSCEGGYRDCDTEFDNGCEAGDADPNHCGTCGNECTFFHRNATCFEGSCVPTTCVAGWDDCDSNVNDCETSLDSLQNCGGCGVSCGPLDHALATCEPGYCTPSTCTGGYGDCDELGPNGCEQTLDSMQHCTGCDVDCSFTGSTNDCSTGTCVAVSCDAPNYADCDGDMSNGCESLSAPTSCGACGQVCDASLPNVSAAVCDDLDCTLTCSIGYDDCNDDWTDGCEVHLVSNTDCGACNTPCAFSNGIGDCSTGSCELTGCNPGFGSCDNDASDGCETNTNTDASNCGACGAPMCTNANGKPYCQGGNCSAIACTPPMADCTGAGSVCNQNLSNDANNCGACGNVCAFATGTPHATLTGCSASKCTISCQGGYADCDGNYQNGCEQALNANNHCGACNMACTVPNGTASCSTGTCQVSTCNPDYGDCTAAPGCETQLNSTAHCNACNAACSFPGAIETCAGTVGARTCQLAGCDQGYLRDCPPNSSADGCETDVRSDVDSCGACGNDCRTHANVDSATCATQLCSYGCDTGFKACDSDPNNGCDTSIRSNTHCGDCGVACSRANAAASCSTGTCTLGACNTGFGNCDGNDMNGCESLSSLQHCGACNTPCDLPNASETCATGSCALGTCEVGWADCDGNALNGCERDVTTLGPCVPDTNCTKQVYQGRDYFFCTNAVNWATARQRCQTQLLGGDLAHIDDLAEQTFVHTNVGDASWIGAGDAAVEGSWRWSNDGAQFWMGAAGGSSVGGLYSRWASGEPNNLNGVQDCAQLYKNALATNGYWDDDDCAATRRFVCEVRGDLCPSDPLKDVPGQCGCGVADTDGDSDGIANCNDQCPIDATNTCLCSDSTENWLETDTDCGGGYCAGCATNDSCSVAADCANKVCTTGTCQAATCSDGVENGTESWIDCGGSCSVCGYRKALTIQGAQVPADLVDFPVLVNVTDAQLAAARADGTDITFRDGANGRLDFEVESFVAATGRLVAWVRLPLVSTGSNTVFYLHYGNGTNLWNGTSGYNATTVWNSGYTRVWHMQDVANLKDSKGVANANNAGATNIAGLIGGASYFDGNDNMYATHAAIDGVSFSVSVWVKRAEISTDRCVITQGRIGAAPGTRQLFHLCYDGPSLQNNRFRFGFWTDDLLSTSAYTDITNYEYWVATYNLSNNAQALYRNGVLESSRTAGGSLSTGSDPVEIGRRVYWWDFKWKGNLDELRISNVARPASWIAAEHANQRAGSTFLTVGTQEAL